MNNLAVFKNGEFGQVRVIMIGSEPWFVGKEIAEILGYAKPLNAVAAHVDEDDSLKQGLEDSLGRMQQTIVINESGLYSLILSSKLPGAKRFKKWVTSEVLPSIRKHGAYMTDNTLEKAITDPDFLIRLATELKKEKEQRQALEKEKKANEPKVIFADSVSASDTTISIAELAKLLKQNGIDTGEKRLFSWLRENGYLIKRKGTDYNTPTQKSLNLEVMEIMERTINNPKGKIIITRTPKVTGKGQQYFINKFL